MITRDDIFDQDRGEKGHYMEADIDDEIELPLTKEGFYALLERVTSVYTLPQDDTMIQVLAGYVHHIPNEKNTSTIRQLATVCYKSVANSTTWRIDQEIKMKLRDEAKELAKKLAEEGSNITPIKQ